MWPRGEEPPDLVCEMGGPGAWGGPSEAVLPSSPTKVVPKSCCLGQGLVPAKDSKDRWVLRENPRGDRAAVEPLGFCLNFILLLGEREQKGGFFAGGKQGDHVWLCPVGL